MEYDVAKLIAVVEKTPASQLAVQPIEYFDSTVRLTPSPIAVGGYPQGLATQQVTRPLPVTDLQILKFDAPDVPAVVPGDKFVVSYSVKLGAGRLFANARWEESLYFEVIGPNNQPELRLLESKHLSIPSAARTASP